MFRTSQDVVCLVAVPGLSKSRAMKGVLNRRCAEASKQQGLCAHSLEQLRWSPRLVLRLSAPLLGVALSSLESAVEQAF